MSKFRLILSVDLRRFLFKEALLSSAMSISLSLRFTRPLYYIISFRVCQGVFQKFFKFFEALSEALASVLDATFILYHILSRLSSGFRKFLEILFSTLLRTLYCFALAHSYNSIPYLPRFVKGFFEFFRNYFSSSVFYHIIFPIFRRCSRFIHIIRPPPSNN